MASITYSNGKELENNCRFGTSKNNYSQNSKITFQCYFSRIFETFSIYRIDGFKNRKIYIQLIRIISLLLRIVKEHDSSFLLPCSVYLPSVMDCNDGRSFQIILFQFKQYFQSLLIMIHEMRHYLM